MAKLTDTQLIMLSKAAAWLGRERLSRVSSKQCRIRRKPSIAARLSYRRARGRRGPLNRRYSGKAVESLEQGQHDCMRGAEDSRRSNRLR
jgi:hypothetical protein